MRFDGALGNIQIPSDFRVVTSLEKQIDDLPLPGAYLAELLFHKNTHLIDPNAGAEIWPLGTSGFGSLRLNLQPRGQIGLPALTSCKNSGCAFFAWKTTTTVVAGRLRAETYSSLAQHLG
jgi:hypothetical protein